MQGQAQSQTLELRTSGGDGAAAGGRRHGDYRPEAYCDEFLSGVRMLLPGSFPLNLLIGKAHQPLGGPVIPGSWNTGRED